MSKQTATTKQFGWNPTVNSFVLFKTQDAIKNGERTGISRLKNRWNGKREVWEVRITATDAGFAWVHARVKECLAEPTLGCINAHDPAVGSTWPGARV